MRPLNDGRERATVRADVRAVWGEKEKILVMVAVVAKVVVVRVGVM